MTSNTLQNPTQLFLKYGPPISIDLAKRIMDGAEREANKYSWPMVIAIVDSTGHLVMLHKMDQAQFGSISVAQLKAETALNFRRPTKSFEDGVTGGGSGLKLLSLPNMLALEGGLLIIDDGEIIGAIGVSGMQSDQDTHVANAGINAAVIMERQ